MKEIETVLEQIDSDISKQKLARNTGRLLAKQARITNKKARG